MQPGTFTIISEPFTANATDYLSQVSADNPKAWFKFQSTTSMLNDGTGGATFDGTYVSPPVTLNTGPLTNDESGTKALKVVKTASSTVPVITATIPTTATWVDRGLYAAGTNYVAGDCVYDTGSQAQAKWYLAKTTSTGQALTNATYWEELLPDSDVYATSLPTREPWTIECWMKYDTQLTRGLSSVMWNTVQGESSSGSVKWGLGWFADLGGGVRGFRFWINEFVNLFVNTHDSSTATWTINPLTWHHIVVTNSGSTSATNSGTQRIFCDGVLHGERVNGTYTQGLATPASTQGAFYMQQGFTRHYPGAASNLEIASTMNTIGDPMANVDIDQLAFYSRQLSEDRVLKHYQAAP